MPEPDNPMSPYLQPNVIVLLFLGFSAGIPILLIFSSLSLWLREAGVDRASVTFFSWAALGYSFKFVWAPLVDKLPLPFLTNYFGRRRAWLFLSQLSIITAIVCMAITDPSLGEHNLTLMALAAVLLGFSSATQDIVIDAYRIESASSEQQAMLSASYIAGYRIAMIVAGAGALYLAEYFGSSATHYSYTAWQLTYLGMAMVMLIGIMTTLMIKEPQNQRNHYDYHTLDYLRFLGLFVMIVLGFISVFYVSRDPTTLLKTALINDFRLNKAFAGFLVESLRLLTAFACAGLVARLFVQLKFANQTMVQTTYIQPMTDFFQRYGLKTALLLLTLVGFYRMSDIVLGVISNVFYQDIGFNKQEIASITKTFGLVMTIFGGFVGGILSIRYGVMRILLLGAVLSAATNLLFMRLASIGHDLTVFTIVIAVDNLSAGLASAAFIAFLSSLTNISFTAVQYAIFSSLMTLFPKLLGGYSGTIVESVGYGQFFLLTTLLGLPVLVLVKLTEKLLVKN